ncbi:MAG: hypothetical protein DRP08_02595 [Candidatus Aenigmatarchaeota archaeon]|nr:MAG: hypothetical protein DRP08_02595 [Candidatus Aenigmarchaeota archaeon]
MKPDLSVIIPARNEEFLQETIDNIALNRRANTEIIVVLDGYNPVLKEVDGLRVIHKKNPIGQRAAVNLGVANSKAKYIMKLDAHCAVDEGFDIKLMADCHPDWTVVPRMYNLHAFNWVCPDCKHETMQGPPIKKCEKCGSASKHTKKIIWKPKWHKRSDFMLFDSRMKFGYWYDYKKRPEAQSDIADQMCAVGACFFMERKRFDGLGGLDENHGGWGQMGVEIACKSWLSGGKQVVNKKTWFSHMFRTNNKGFSFPYKISGNDIHRARKYSQRLWKGNKWPLAVRSLEWLVDRFSPVPGWEVEKRRAKQSSPLLSVIIPARNEKYLQATIDDILKNFTTDYEIIVGLDSYDPDPPLAENGRIKIIKTRSRAGMRSLINRMVNIARGKYIMKTDAHCSFDKGYDQKLIDICRYGDTVLGIRHELDVKRWERKERTNCDFRYLSNPDVDKLGGLRGLPWHEYKKKTKGQIVSESMSLSGSGWLMERTQFLKWGGLDENHGTMYQEGAEIACKTWLSGGRLLINRTTWYAHWNRGKAPYALGKYHRQKSIDYSIDLWMNNKWPLQKYSFNWLIDKFKPPGWPLPKHATIRAKSQGTNLKGYKGLSVDELWEKRLGISEPLKRYRLEIFFDAFMRFLKGDEERYYNYLMSHRMKRPREITDRDIQHVRRKMKNARKLYADIKENGLMAPLEFYRKRGNIILFRGYRRLAILKELGYKKVSARVHINEETAKRFAPGYSWQPGSIAEIGARQFAKHGGMATDKHYVHNYLPIYDNLFAPLRRRRVKIIEIGLLYGASLALWHQAFPKAQIFGLDKNRTVWQRMIKGLDRIKVFVGMQEDERILAKVAASGPYDIIIDDCGHNPESQWTSFKALWPRLNPGGYYVIEDCYRSFKKGYDGFNLPMEMAGWVESIYNSHEVGSLQFYYNLCIVQKGLKP